MRGGAVIGGKGRRLAGLLVGAACWALLASSVQAQLISPGKLSSPHRNLEGIRNCTSCHVLGQRGVDNARCLDCHTPLENRIQAKRGYHATVASQNCASCHKEHFGVDFALVRFDTSRFDHGRTGFRLTGAHGRVSCRSCHRPAFLAAQDVRAFKAKHGGALARTYLGLATRCQGCHAADNPHGDQFAGKECQTCHATDTWEEAPGFNHDRARFKLTGRHREVACVSCHPRRTRGDKGGGLQFVGLSFAGCASCHEDRHGGAFGKECQSCHSPSGWGQIRNFSEAGFDHAATGFRLVGRHARLACASCHATPARRDAAIRITFVPGTAGNTYPAVQARDCLSCHVDVHRGTFTDVEGGAGCDNCHGQDAWEPVDYDIERHNREARFELTGAHLATPCMACHGGEGAHPTFTFASLACASCHADDNPHGTQFADATGTTACENCHTTEVFGLDPSFDHTETGYPLTGRHATVACASCHRPREETSGKAVTPFRGLDTACLSCHGDDDPHEGQFAGLTCETCHTTEGFALAAAAFDHSGTRFPLEGAHEDVACASCHRQETAPDGHRFLRFKPLGTACKDCHGTR